MCDYSLHAVQHARAKVGETLVTTTFRGTSTPRFRIRKRRMLPGRYGVSACNSGDRARICRTIVRVRQSVMDLDQDDPDRQCRRNSNGSIVHRRHRCSDAFHHDRAAYSPTAARCCDAAAAKASASPAGCRLPVRASCASEIARRRPRLEIDVGSAGEFDQRWRARVAPSELALVTFAGARTSSPRR